MAIQETILLDARSKLNAKNHRKAHVPFAGLFRGSRSSILQICLKRTMNIREPRFDEPGAQNANFRVGLSLHRELANGFPPTACIERTTNIRQRQLPELFFEPRRTGAPRHKHVQLEGQFRSLVHILCVWQELQWSWVECHNFYSR